MIGCPGERNEMIEVGMTKPVIFTVSAIWDNEAKVWSGHCDDIPAAADAPTLDELMEKISQMAFDLAPDNHPGVQPGSIFIQVRSALKLDGALV
jgi:Domain of unknown function (DUF1902)